MQASTASNALNTLQNYGSFYSTRTQTNLTDFNAITFNVTDLSKGISINQSAKSQIVISYAGFYNIAFSAQVDKTDSGTDTINFWLRKNGNNESWSNTSVTLPGNDAKAVAAWNFFVNAAAGDYYELIWYSADTDMRLFAQDAQTDPIVMPGIPSVILTVNQVG